MDEKEFQNYQLLEMASTFALNGVWISLQEKIKEKISKLDESAFMDYDEISLLKDAISTFDKQIQKVKESAGAPQKRQPRTQSTSSQGTTRSEITEEEAEQEYLEAYLKWESEKINEILTRLPGIFSDVFDSFIGDVQFYAKDNDFLQKQPNLIKFLVFNLTERFSPDVYEPHTCDFDHGFKLFKSRNTYHKQHLMQGFEGVELMIQKLRNGIIHKHDKEGKKILRDLGRTVEDPITSTPTFGNMITLCSILILCGYQLDEIIQTRIDTITFQRREI